MNSTTEFFNRLTLLLCNIGIILGFILAIYLIIKQKIKKANLFLGLYFLIFTIRITKSIFYQYLPINFTVHSAFLASVLLIGPLIYFYTNSLLKTKLKNISYYIHTIPFLATLFISLFVYFQLLNSVFSLFLFLHPITYMLFILTTIVKNKEISSVNNKWIFLLSSLTIIFFINSILIYFRITSFYPSSAILFSCLTITLSIKAFQTPAIFQPEKIKYANSSLNKTEAEQYYQKLQQIIENDKLYLDPELTLKKLSDLIGITSKQLSQIINQVNQINYSQYIAAYRVNEAKKMLTDDAYKNYKISSIAYECGFNSISSFNSAFKKLTNTTAQQYRTEQ